MRITVGRVYGFLTSGSVLICVIIFSGSKFHIDGGLIHSVTRCVSRRCIRARCSRGHDHKLSHLLEPSGTCPTRATTLGLTSIMSRLSRDFSRVLLHGVSRGNLASSRYCGGTGISHGLFSGVEGGIGCGPGGAATVTFTITLRLSLSRAGRVLRGTNCTLSRSGGFSIVVRCFVRGNRCSVFAMGRTLFRFSRILLNRWVSRFEQPCIVPGIV